ncbi:MAG: CDP-alcohol phosphatidyltransferase family protein [Pseudomonadota bacterium]
MFPTEPHREELAYAPMAPLQALFRAGLGLSLLVVCVSLVAFGSPYIPLVIFASATAIAGYGLLRGYPHDVLGACNVITLSRVALTALLCGALFSSSTSAWLVFGLAALAFALDGFDGWLARRTGLASDFGARFDMEADSALAAVLALLLMSDGIAGVEILVLGFARYAFVLAGFLVPQLTKELAPSLRRKLICVIQIATLLGLHFPLSPDHVSSWLPIGAALLLAWSFVIDIRWLLRRTA